jgi:hypothetical protein
MIDLFVQFMKFIQALQTFILIFALQQGAPAISAPLAGETLQGQISIQGTADAPNFASAALAFAYASSPTDTWFPLQTFAQPVQDSTLFVWDTSQLSDGEYILRLRVYSQDGSFQDFTVANLEIRNEAAPATATLTPTRQPTAEIPVASTPSTLTAESEPLPTETPAPVPASAATPAEYSKIEPLPANPAALTADAIYFDLARGALLALILFIVLGIFLRLRRD